MAHAPPSGYCPIFACRPRFLAKFRSVRQPALQPCGDSRASGRRDGCSWRGGAACNDAWHKKAGGGNRRLAMRWRWQPPLGNAIPLVCISFLHLSSSLAPRRRHLFKHLAQTAWHRLTLRRLRLLGISMRMHRMRMRVLIKGAVATAPSYIFSLCMASVSQCLPSGFA